MAKAKRNIGAEILAGIRDLKAGRVGRVVNVLPATQVAAATTCEEGSIREGMRSEYRREEVPDGLTRGKYAARLKASAKAHGSAVEVAAAVPVVEPPSRRPKPCRRPR